MDDFSPAPIAPQIVESEEVLDQIDIQEDKQLADAYFHPAWAKVEEIIAESINSLSAISSVDANLNSEEFAIE
jgi:hypothetical protein